MRALAVSVLLLGFVHLLPAQTSFPMVTHTVPVAVQRGTTAEVVVEGKMNFAGAYKVLISGDGVQAEVVPPPAPKTKPDPKAKPTASSVKVKLTVSPTAPLGVREFRIGTAQGVSSLGQLIITADPVVVEAQGINTLAKAQTIPVPSVVCGRIEAAENQDFYKFTAKAGEVLTFEVYCARIQDKIHDLQKHADPLVRVCDHTGRELAASDDSYFADPLLSYKIPADGEYTVEIRDAVYDGDPRWVYALAITNQPYATHVYPLAVNPGQPATVVPVGSARLTAPRITFTPPTQPGIHAVPLPVGNGETNPVPLVVTPLPLVQEVEPNDAIDTATRITIPGGANGQIQEARDLDYYRFTAKKGQTIKFEVFARRFGTVLRSRTDITMDLMTADGKRTIASNDDVNGKDPQLVYTATADGDYILRLRDLNNQGGEGFAYFLEADFDRPDFAIKCDPSKAMIGPGSRTAWYVQVLRRPTFKGPVRVTVEGLPPGITVNPLTIPENMTVGCLVLTAAKDAKMDCSIVRVLGTAEIPGADGKPQATTREATPVEEIYMPGGGRGRFDVGMQAASITDPSDLLEVAVGQNTVSLKPGQEVKIPVTVKRRADYDKGVTLDIFLQHLRQRHADPMPPGVTFVEGKSKTLLGTKSEGYVVLKAAADAPECTNVPICVQGFVSINFVVKVGYASEPIWITVKK
ncbi:MAG: PPC domain-containing protein [Bacteroidales bacterium]|nr:PPC domain-containing protein [Bacteroidales bacterium]